MTVAAMIVLTGTQRDAAMLLNQGSEGINVNPIPINNDMANNLGYGTLVGLYVLNAARLNDSAWVAIWGEMFASNPIYVLDTDTIYEPAD